MNLNELAQTAELLNTLAGAQLQEIVTFERELGLGLYLKGATRWIWVDMNANCPICLLLPGEPPVTKGQTTPLLLFLRAHARSRMFLKAEIDAGHGRVMLLQFSHGFLLELRLFPHGQNIIARSLQAQLSYTKIQALEASPEMAQDENRRLAEQIYQEWTDSRQAKPKKQMDPLIRPKAQLEKKENARLQMQKNLRHLQSAPWAPAGEHIKIHGFNELPKIFSELVDRRRSVSWNIQNCFTRAKEVAKKIAGQTERLRKIEGEITHLRQILADPTGVSECTTTQPTRKMQRPSEMKLRTFVSHGFELRMGKSARDNLALLRSSQGWDYWLHLRDYPGAHGIIHRNKKQSVPREALEELSRSLVRQSLSSKIVGNLGGSFDVVLTECRFVRPIKGDSLGRVHYTHEQTLTIRL